MTAFSRVKIVTEHEVSLQLEIRMGDILGGPPSRDNTNPFLVSFPWSKLKWKVFLRYRKCFSEKHTKNAIYMFSIIDQLSF